MSDETTRQIDAAIMSVARRKWQKVALIIVEASTTSDERYDNVVADRIKALVATCQLEAKGDLSRWRRSEVRLPSSLDAE